MRGTRLVRYATHAALLAAAAALCAIPGCGDDGAAKTEPLLCYVGGTMRPAMEDLAKRYEARTGQKVLIDYAGSGELLIKIENTRRGDLYVAHDPFQAALMHKRLGVRGWTVAAVTPVIVVPKGNPKRISGFRDLARPGLRLVFSHPTYSTAGWIIRAAAKKAGITKELEANIVTRTKGGGSAANQVSIGHADAAVCWNAVAYLRRDKLDAVEFEPDLRLRKDADAISSATFGRIDMGYVKVTIATLGCSERLEAATAFAEFAASEANAKVWADFGFSPVDRLRSGDVTAAPALGGSIFVHCAAGMRLPVSVLAKEFETRRGVRVNLTYAGTNMLLGQIELTRKGDVYIAGDADYIDMAAQKGLVKSRKTLCYFVPVIMVQEGNPKGLKTLANLTAPGMRIGQGDPKAAAVGRLTPKILDLNGVDRAAWWKNVKLQTPTVNELGLKIKLGTIDAALVWRSTATKYLAGAGIVELDPKKNICPVVAGAVLSFSKSPAAAAAFLDFLASKRGRQVLTENGYTVTKP